MSKSNKENSKPNKSELEALKKIIDKRSAENIVLEKMLEQSKRPRGKRRGIKP